jgi:hypothetical protein
LIDSDTLSYFSKHGYGLKPQLTAISKYQILPSRKHTTSMLQRGLTVAQSVEALRFKPEGRVFDSRRCHWNFSLTNSLRSHYGPVDSASNRNEYQVYFLGCKGGRCVGLTTLTPSCADCLEILEPQPPRKLRAYPGL